MSESPQVASTNIVSDEVRAALRLFERWADAKPIIYNGSNFQSWELNIQTIVKTRRAGFLFHGCPQGARELDEVVLLLLRQSVVEGSRHLTRSASNFSQAFNAVKRAHESFCQANQLPAHDALYGKRQQSSETVVDFIASLEKLRIQYLEAGGDIKENAYLTLICNRVSSAFSSVTALHASKPFTDLCALRGALVAVENAPSGAGPEGNFTYGTLKYNNNLDRGGRGRLRGRGRGHGQRGQRGPQKWGKDRSQKEMVCYTCGYLGHMSKDCPDRKDSKGVFRAGKSSGTDARYEANHADSFDVSRLLLQTCLSTPQLISLAEPAEACSARPTTEEQMMYDNGCNMHLTPHREVLHDYYPVPKGWGGVRWGSNSRADDISGFGTIVLRTTGYKGVRHVRIPDVAYV